MKSFGPIVIALLFFSACADRQPTVATQGIYSVTPVDIKDVVLSDRFWAPIVERNRTVTLPYVFGKCEETDRINNFVVAAGAKEGEYVGERYNDSDVFKIIEGACYSIMTHPDARLEKYVDSLVTLIAAAQEPDGYLYTNRTIDPTKPAPGAGRDRWIDVWVSHELYNAGHMYESAVAHYRATGKRTFLDVAIKNADLVNKEFGWGKREAAPGHQEIEIGLVKLYQATGNKEYLDLAQFFLDVRGTPQEFMLHEPGTRFAVYNDAEYLQQHKPVLEQTEAVGHSVRGAYMYTGMADVSNETGDRSYLDVSEKIWNDVVSGKIYITGGIGSKARGEAFGAKYELPNMSAYTETCASVANVFWNDRLFRATGNGAYMDVLEKTLYNGLISGIGLDGMNFFYPNPLESDGRFQRSGWFDCSCCPGNVARFMPAMAQYIYATAPEKIFVNLYVASHANVKMESTSVKITQETDYPWDGNAKIIVNPAEKKRFTVAVRIPAWAVSAPIEGGLYRFKDDHSHQVQITLNGAAVDYKEDKGYALITRKWQTGDVINITLPMEARTVVAKAEVAADSGRLCIERGPLVYCLEEADNGKVRDVKITANINSRFSYQTDLLGGVGILQFKAFSPEGDEKEYTAIPYYSWANRGRGEMIVWMHEKKNE